jgi:MFS family permease
MGLGPIVAAIGVTLELILIDETPRFFADVLPGVIVFSLGLAMTVAPLTAAILADADEHNAGIASGVNNAVARVAGLLATASIGAIIGGAVDLDGFRIGMTFAAVLLALGGLVGLLFIRNEPRRQRVLAEDCPGGQITGAPRDAARDRVGRDPDPVPA